jgi:hypothetical protein
MAADSRAIAIYWSNIVTYNREIAAYTHENVIYIQEIGADSRKMTANMQEIHAYGRVMAADIQVTPVTTLETSQSGSAGTTSACARAALRRRLPVTVQNAGNVSV